MKLLTLPLLALLAAAGACACDMAHVRQGGRVEDEERASHSEPRTTAAPARSSAAPPPSASTAPTPSSVPTPPPAAGSSAPTSDGGAASGCEAPDVQRDLAEQLFRDEDFHLYICGEKPCTAQEFLDGLRFTEVILRDAPRTSGCIVGPLHEAMTRIYGVFVLNEPTPNLELIYLGIDISVDREFKKPGFKDLVGTERVDPGTWVTHRYVWTHRGYALESTTKAVER